MKFILCKFKMELKPMVFYFNRCVRVKQGDNATIIINKELADF